VTAFVASVSKVAMVAILLRYSFYADLARTPALFYAIAVFAALSMLIGNIMAIVQKDLKRLLAYSSIAHLGYLLVGVLAVAELAPEAVIFYISVYSLTILGSFGLIALISNADRESTEIESFQGLFWRRPMTAGFLSVFLFSLAGIPLTAGFIGKYLVILAGVGSALTGLVIVLIVTSVVGLYYYLRVIAVMLSTEASPSEADGQFQPVSAARTLLLGAVALAIIYLGVYPGPLVDLIRQAVLNSFL
jgi:NADH-quinone oxidoreductase subunit N